MNDKKAVALRYKRGEDKAPKVVAKGKGFIGEKIIQIAKENGIPVEKDPVLVEALSGIEINQEIPPQLYKAVAKILIFVYRKTKEIENS
ncbi:flagellar biosynthesis protein [Persephonella hydrogeniphila]|uniref:Flagellar biosynthesis protein n=1 Tax=Persephonella hydrogeniphila TaxID=198703 RepID=A0A285NJP3_9AQUI|nr:EscU/YscU/HrcU family type III secretion system export apparatus switch protein [Persephonella hydrogeniphila]SNZ09710.1 flagellar biosynthesis protein [Persephonella hydrogeniphila]